MAPHAVRCSNLETLRADFYVSAKADGVNCSVDAGGLRLECEELRDGRLVVLDVVGDDLELDESFPQRLARARGLTHADDGRPLVHKEFAPARGNSRRVWDEQTRLPFPADGIVFVAEFGRTVFKLKPLEKTTIDVQLRVVPDGRLFQLLARGGTVVQETRVHGVPEEIEVQSSQPGGSDVVVELGPHPTEASTWIFNRVRRDKDAPNAYLTIDDTFRAVSELRMMGPEQMCDFIDDEHEESLDRFQQRLFQDTRGLAVVPDEAIGADEAPEPARKTDKRAWRRALRGDRCVRAREPGLWFVVCRGGKLRVAPGTHRDVHPLGSERVAAEEIQTRHVKRCTVDARGPGTESVTPWARSVEAHECINWEAFKHQEREIGRQAAEHGRALQEALSANTHRLFLQSLSNLHDNVGVRSPAAEECTLHAYIVSASSAVCFDRDCDAVVCELRNDENEAYTGVQDMYVPRVRVCDSDFLSVFFRYFGYLPCGRWPDESDQVGLYERALELYGEGPQEAVRVLVDARLEAKDERSCVLAFWNHAHAPDPLFQTTLKSSCHPHVIVHYEADTLRLKPPLPEGLRYRRQKARQARHERRYVRIIKSVPEDLYEDELKKAEAEAEAGAEAENEAEAEAEAEPDLGLVRAGLVTEEDARARADREEEETRRKTIARFLRATSCSGPDAKWAMEEAVKHYAEEWKDANPHIDASAMEEEEEEEDAAAYVPPAASVVVARDALEAFGYENGPAKDAMQRIRGAFKAQMKEDSFSDLVRHNARYDAVADLARDSGMRPDLAKALVKREKRPVARADFVACLAAWRHFRGRKDAVEAVAKGSRPDKETTQLLRPLGFTGRNGVRAAHKALQSLPW